MKIYIDAACDIKYASFYIEGIRSLYGKRSIRFTSKYFQGFKHNNHYFAFVAKRGDQTTKIIIDFLDAPKIATEAYDWCDVYAKINIAFEDYGKYEKLFSIGPGFGVRLFSPIQTITQAFVNLIKAKSRISNIRQFLSDYKGQLDRFPVDRYLNTDKSKDDYIYFVATLWKNNPDTNLYRANFIKASKNIREVTFEGGFAPRVKNDIQGFEALTMNHRDSMPHFVAKTKSSLVVFNTPAVSRCHGWKLAEFLAMGKAIISTPISRVLPKELGDRQQILITDGSQEDIEAKIRLLLSEPDLKQKLEEQALEYYNDFLAPDKVISSILKKAGLA